MAILINKTLRVEFPIAKSAVVGRSTEADLQLNFPTVSKKHLRVFDADGTWCVEDLGSANSTYVNGEKISRKELKTGDYIRLDAYTLVFFVNAPPSLPEIIVQDPTSVIRQRLFISQPVLRIGRSLSENHVPIDDPSVSGRHLNLKRTGKHWRIEFAKPGVHVRVNENLVDDGMLINPGDRIRIGSSLLEVNIQTPKEWNLISQVNLRLEDLYKTVRMQARTLENLIHENFPAASGERELADKLNNVFILVEDSLKLLGEISETVRVMIPAIEDFEADEKVLEQGLRLSRRCNNLANYLDLVLYNNQLVNIQNADLSQQRDLVARLYRNVQGCLENDSPTIRL